MNSMYRARARESLNGNWLTVIVCTILYTLIIGIISIIFAVILSGIYNDLSASFFVCLRFVIQLLVISMMTGCLVGIILDVARNREVTISNFFTNIDRFLTVLLVLIITIIATSIGFLLCVIPGIYIALRLYYAMYVCIDNPHLDAMECVEMSFSITRGHVLDILSLSLSYMGWYLVSIMGCGIPLIAVIPYVFVGHCHLYLDLIGENPHGPNTDSIYNNPSASFTGAPYTGQYSQNDYGQGFNQGPTYQQPQQGYTQPQHVYAGQQQQGYTQSQQGQQGYVQPQQVQQDYTQPQQGQQDYTQPQQGQRGYTQSQQYQQGYIQSQHVNTGQTQSRHVNTGQTQQSQQDYNMNNPY